MYWGLNIDPIEKVIAIKKPDAGFWNGVRFSALLE
jgi:hypothetical protein